MTWNHRLPLLSYFSGLFLLLFSLEIAVVRPEAGQSARVPVPASAGPSKPRADRPGFPPIPKFKVGAAEVGLRASDFSTPYERYIVESTIEGTGYVDLKYFGERDAVMEKRCS